MSTNQLIIQTLISDFKLSFYADDLNSMQRLFSVLCDLCISDPHLPTTLLSVPEFQTFKQDTFFFEQCISHLNSGDWEVISESDDIKVESHCSGADFYTRASVLINAGILETISVVCEVDLLPSW